MATGGTHLRLHRILNRALWFSVMIIINNTCGAHPGSHVDVWVQIDKHLEIRVNLFLDDVLASQSKNTPVSNTHLTAERVRKSLTQFDETLKTLLIIYDADGRRLLADVIGRPAWSPADTDVNQEMDTRVRLTWKLRFPWNQTHKSFSVQHYLVAHDSATGSDLTNPAVDSQCPAELRLRVRSGLSARRIETVIASHQPRTIVLPSVSTGVSLPQNQSPAVAELSLLPGRLIHEFTIPLALSTDCIGLRRNNRDHENHGFDTDSDTVRQLAVEWVRNHFEISVDGRAAPAESLFVGLLTAEHESINEADTVPLIGTRLGIRTTHRTAREPKQLTVSWTAVPEGVNQIQLHTVSGVQDASRLIDRSQESLQLGSFQYTWVMESKNDLVVKKTGQNFASEKKLNGSHPAVVEDLTDRLWQHHTDSRIEQGALWMVLAVAITGTIAGICRKWRLWVTASMISFTLGTALVLSGVQRIAAPDSETAAALIQHSLQKAYHSVLVSGDRLAVEQLSEVFTDDMVESVFQRMAENAEQGPFVRIGDVQVIHCLTENFIPYDSARFRCIWQVDGEILHWGHRHQRNMRLTGVIRLETKNGHCRIGDLTLQHAEYKSDSRKS